MQRFLVVILAAFDAVIAVATGVAVALAPLTLLWVFGVGDPVWPALWPAAGTVWQLGHFVPLSITLPGEYLALTGIDAEAASFALSLAPLAFAAFTAIFAARSGARAARAGAWITGVGTATVVVAALAAAIGLTCRNAVAAATLWQAVLFPTLVYAGAALCGALVTAWRDGDGGVIDALRTRVDALPGPWSAAPGAVARGSAVALVGLVGVGAAAVAVALVLRGGEVLALYQRGNLDVLGATVMTLGQLAYLPTLVVWASAFVAGPGFALGVGTAVSPAGTQLGVVPAIPVLGVVPEVTSPWLLTLALAPVVLGGLAGWAVRGRIGVPETQTDATAAVPVPPALVGLIPERDEAPAPAAPVQQRRPTAVLAVVALGIAVVTAGGAGLLALAAAGSLGPGRLAAVGPSPGPVALCVGLETLVGAGIVLLNTRVVPRRRARSPQSAAAVAAAEPPRVEASGSLLDELRARVADDRPSAQVPEAGSAPGDDWHSPGNDAPDAHEPDAITAPVVLPDPATLGRHRPPPLPPLD